MRILTLSGHATSVERYHFRRNRQTHSDTAGLLGHARQEYSIQVIRRDSRFSIPNGNLSPTLSKQDDLVYSRHRAKVFERSPALVMWLQLISTSRKALQMLESEE